MHIYKIEGEYMAHDDDLNLWKLDAGRDEPEHLHEFIELAYVCTGSARQEVDERVYTVSRGSLIFINRNQTHSFQRLENPFCYVNFVFKPSFISKELVNTENLFSILALSMFEELQGAFEKAESVVRFSGRELVEVETVIENMLYEYEHREKGYRTALRGYASVIFTHLTRHLQKNANHDMDEYSHKITSDILQYIDEHYNQKITVAELASRCFYHPSYFSTVFKECYGKSLVAYIQDKRMTKAIELLEEPSLSLQEISEQVGYQSYQLFSKIFKRHTGETPSAYRAKFQK